MSNPPLPPGASSPRDPGDDDRPRGPERAPGGGTPPERSGPHGGARRPEAAPDLGLARDRAPAPEGGRRPAQPPPRENRAPGGAQHGAPPRNGAPQRPGAGPARPERQARTEEPAPRNGQGPRRGAGHGAGPGPGRGDGPDRGPEEGRASSEKAGVPVAGGGASSATTAMILHAITFLCCFNWLFGVAGIVFAVRAGHARDRGMLLKAETLTRYSWYCLGAAGVMLFVMSVLTFVVFTRTGSWLQQITGLVPY